MTLLATKGLNLPAGRSYYSMQYVIRDRTLVLLGSGHSSCHYGLGLTGYADSTCSRQLKNHCGSSRRNHSTLNLCPKP
jgi:hypothetical protein